MKASKSIMLVLAGSAWIDVMLTLKMEIMPERVDETNDSMSKYTLGWHLQSPSRLHKLIQLVGLPCEAFFLRFCFLIESIKWAVVDTEGGYRKSYWSHN